MYGTSYNPGQNYTMQVKPVPKYADKDAEYGEPSNSPLFTSKRALVVVVGCALALAVLLVCVGVAGFIANNSKDGPKTPLQVDSFRPTSNSIAPGGAFAKLAQDFKASPVKAIAVAFKMYTVPSVIVTLLVALVVVGIIVGSVLVARHKHQLEIQEAEEERNRALAGQGQKESGEETKLSSFFTFFSNPLHLVGSILVVVVVIFVTVYMCCCSCGGKTREKSMDENATTATVVVANTTGNTGTINNNTTGSTETKDNIGKTSAEKATNSLVIPASDEEKVSEIIELFKKYLGKIREGNPTVMIISTSSSPRDGWLPCNRVTGKNSCTLYVSKQNRGLFYCNLGTAAFSSEILVAKKDGRMKAPSEKYDEHDELYLISLEDDNLSKTFTILTDDEKGELYKFMHALANFEYSTIF